MIYRLYNAARKVWDGSRFKNPEAARLARLKLTDHRDWLIIWE